jgi:hypothetical protein
MKKLWATQGRGEEVFFIEKSDTHCKAIFLDGHEDNPRPLEMLDDFTTFYECGEVVETPMVSGAFFPRIWRDAPTPSPRVLGPLFVAEWVANVRASRMLFSKLEGLFAAVEPHEMQDLTYGLLQREILILACTLAESAWRSVLEANNARPLNGSEDRWTTSDYVRLLKPMRLDEWRVSLSSHHAYRDLRPFNGWDEKKATKSLPWYDAYNAVKHGWETSLQQATFGVTVDAVAAAFIMSTAQFGPRNTPTVTISPHFHPDVFTVEATPKWLPTERYIPPSQLGLERGAWLGHQRWERTFCPDLGDSLRPS